MDSIFVRRPSSVVLFLLLLCCCFEWTVGAVNSEEDNERNNDREGNDKCMVYRPDKNNSSHQELRHHRAKRITGGLEGDIREMPWLVYLSAYYLRRGQMQFTNCTGSLISRRHVLTAGHCVNRLLPMPNNTLTVRYGTSNRTVGRQLVLDVSATHLHPNYTTFVSGQNLLSPYDLAIVDLGEDLEFDDTVHSVCFVCLDKNSTHYTSGTVIINGWGNTAGTCNGKPSVYAEVFRYDFVTIHACLTPDFVLIDKVCTLADETHGIGGGDSGGPVLANVVDGDIVDPPHSPRYVQVGVHGGNNCQANARENNFDKIDGKWVEQVTGIKCGGCGGGRGHEHH